MGKPEWMTPDDYQIAIRLLNRWLIKSADESTINYGTTDDTRLDSLMLTINPAPGVRTKDFVSKVHTFAARKTVQPHLRFYSFEQRSTDENEFSGVHVHMCFAGCRPSHLKKWALSTFKKMVGNEKHCDVRKVNLEACETYCKGMKKGKPKVAHEIDILFREKYNLHNIYYQDGTV